MGISVAFSTPYYTGTGGASSQVPGVWDVALGGRGYVLDLESPDPFTGRTLPSLRGQADQGRSPSEASINPEDLWRRSQDTWHHGAGQSVLDRDDSDPARFRTSKGVDVFDQWELSLLPATDQKKTSANTNVRVAVAGTHLYLTDGTSIQYTTDVTVGTPTWTDITGEPANAGSSITSDGFNVYTAHGSNGIYKTTRGGASTASYVTGTVALVRYVKGRLIAAQDNIVYNVTAAGALPTALFTHPNTDFDWVDFCEGQNAIYAAGFSGDKSLIYQIGIQPGGTGLNVPIVAGELPDGEIVRSLGGYLGFILVGTDRGVRLASADGAGNLIFGSLIPATEAVRCFEGQDRFVWFGWSDYDATSTGLGRLDLSAFTDLNTPAYASDLMAVASGDVLTVATFQNVRVFTVSGSGVWAQDTVPVASGTLETGRITYAFPHQKVAMFVDVTHDGVGSHTVSLAADGDSFVALGTHTNTDTPFSADETRGYAHELKLALTAVTDVAPTVRSYTLRAYPVTPTVEEIIAPLLLHETVSNRVGQQDVDPLFEREVIRSWRRDRQLLSWQDGETQQSVVIEDFTWVPHHFGRRAWNGTLLVRLKTIRP